MSEQVFIVTETHKTTAGTSLHPGVLRDDPRVEVGDLVTITRPDGSSFDARVTRLALYRNPTDSIPVFIESGEVPMGSIVSVATAAEHCKSPFSRQSSSAPPHGVH